jgi:hypothetical protein
MTTRSSRQQKLLRTTKAGPQTGKGKVARDTAKATAAALVTAWGHPGRTRGLRVQSRRDSAAADNHDLELNLVGTFSSAASGLTQLRTCRL